MIHASKVLLLLGLFIPLLALSPAGAAGRSKHTSARDPFVARVEAWQHMTPGATRVVPELGSTIQYLGTSVSGNVYSVRIRRLD